MFKPESKMKSLFVVLVALFACAAARSAPPRREIVKNDIDNFVRDLMDEHGTVAPSVGPAPPSLKKYFDDIAQKIISYMAIQHGLIKSWVGEQFREVVAAKLKGKFQKFKEEQEKAWENFEENKDKLTKEEIVAKIEKTHKDAMAFKSSVRAEIHAHLVQLQDYLAKKGIKDEELDKSVAGLE
ncbi:uncharacterized protein LOC116609474 [Nematostella vectensis]|uniref:uncharacterized protein LOC116609474 n=1 Tax=Nematostella vectensis TaxID=45351 RepID=UPI0013903F6A|nr:uncharacterized protein LOC116609474 [Nematostella vectensis]